MQKIFIDKVMSRDRKSNYFTVNCVSKVKQQSLINIHRKTPLCTDGSVDLKTIQKDSAVPIGNTI